MKLITRYTDYAIRALCYIAGHKDIVVSIPALVKKLEIPKPFLRKILQILNKKRILKSEKGKGGGFVLAKPADKIFLMDIIEIFQGPFKLNECLFKKSICPNVKICPLKQKIDEIEQYAILKLKPVTISKLILGSNYGKKKNNKN